MKKALKKDYIRVDGKPASTATWIRGGEKIELQIPEEAIAVKPVDLRLAVLWEDDYLAIIRKPAGIPVSGNKFRTVANALSQNIKNTALPDATLPQPVHRLDYATSGLLLVGKTRSSIRSLNRMFEEKKVRKFYFAVTIGKMNKGGVITEEIDGKPARSAYRLLDSVASKRFGFLNLVELSPESGRRHQLRKHLAHLGNPVLGDKLYSPADLVLQGKGLYLHAAILEFDHLFTGEKVQVRDELPQKFKKIFPQSAEK